jgi:hypothetical protein
MKFESFYSHLFQFDREETRGDYILIKFLEFVMLFQVLMYAWRWAGYMPLLSEVILPLGIANYMDVTFMFQSGFAYANAALITIFMLIGFLDKWRFSYIIALLFFHLHYVSRYSQGEISHGSNLTAMVLLSFALAAIFFQDKSVRRKISFGFVIFFGGLGYVSAAMSKLIGGGIFWSDGAHMYLWMGERSIDRLSQDGLFEFNLLQNLMFDHYWLSTLILTFGLLVELTGFLLWFKKTRWIQATLLIGMHVGILVTMNIYFGPYIYILLIIGFPWNDWINRVLEKKPHSELNTLIDRRLYA